MIREQTDYTFAPTPFGEVLVAATPKGVCALLFVTSHEAGITRLGAMFPKADLTWRRTPLLEQALEVFDKKDICVPLDLRGTPFQIAVWNALLEIPRRRTATYGEIASRIGRPKACRAVGSAVGSNPVSVIVPCHRVLPRSGGIGNYGWGAQKKAALLEYEETY